MPARGKAGLLLTATGCIALVGFGIGGTLAGATGTSTDSGQFDAIAPSSQLGVEQSTREMRPPTAVTSTQTSTTTASAPETVKVAESAKSAEPIRAAGELPPPAPNYRTESANLHPAPVQQVKPPAAPPPATPAPQTAPPIVNAIPYSPIPPPPFEVEGNTVIFR